ncbi:hypothetical protein ACFZAV_43400 [Streptomyces sp. NPDC008343]|uniref:hypothetical protein n=1 Tax=Streptomyces sp. NPDC008343 TaxID=3364828 RepID=UPI0036E18A58
MSRGTVRAARELVVGTADFAERARELFSALGAFLDTLTAEQFQGMYGRLLRLGRLDVRDLGLLDFG